MAHKILPSQDYLRQCIDYDPETGTLTWKERPRGHFISQRGHSVWNARFFGKPCGCLHKPSGYIFVTINDSKYKAHRIIWRFMTGEAPIETDHRDLNRSNNRWDNLREATHSQNTHNCTVRKRTESGVKGVYFDKRRGLFYSRIQIAYRTIHLGYFTTSEETKRAYDAASISHMGAFARS